jgi:hypothetical protein
MYACRLIQILAAIAFHSQSHFRLAAYDAVRADHGAHPAAHTFLFIAIDNSGDGVLEQCTGTTDGDTGCLQAMAAEQRYILTLGLLHINPAYRSRLLRYGAE